MISVIIPTYNDGAYLDACLDSIRSQQLNGQTIEVIVVDDGSEGKELRSEGVKEFRSEGVIFIRQEHAGQSAARNRGLQAAKGEFIVFVDADDRLEPDWMAQHLSAIEGVDYVQSGYTRTAALLDRCAVRPAEGLKDRCADRHIPRHRWQFTSPCMRMYRREAIEGMRFEEGMIYEDVLWSVDLWQRNLKCRMIPYAGYLYTLNPKSTTSRPHPEAEKRVLQELHKRLKALSPFAFRPFAIILYTILRLKLHFRKLKIERKKAISHHGHGLAIRKKTEIIVRAERDKNAEC